MNKLSTLPMLAVLLLMLAAPMALVGCPQQNSAPKTPAGAR